MYNCEEYVELISVYADGELSESDKGKVEAHLNECADCSSILAVYREISETMEDSKIPAPESVRVGVMEKIEKTREERIAANLKKSGRVSIILTRYVPIAACLVFLLLTIPRFFGTGRDMNNSKSDAALSVPSATGFAAGSGSAGGHDGGSTSNESNDDRNGTTENVNAPDNILSSSAPQAAPEPASPNQSAPPPSQAPVPAPTTSPGQSAPPPSQAPVPAPTTSPATNTPAPSSAPSPSPGTTFNETPTSGGASIPTDTNQDTPENTDRSDKAEPEENPIVTPPVNAAPPPPGYTGPETGLLPDDDSVGYNDNVFALITICGGKPAALSGYTPLSIADNGEEYYEIPRAAAEALIMEVTEPGRIAVTYLNDNGTFAIVYYTA